MVKFFFFFVVRHSTLTNQTSCLSHTEACEYVTAFIISISEKLHTNSELELNSGSLPVVVACFLSV